MSAMMLPLVFFIVTIVTIVTIVSIVTIGVVAVADPPLWPPREVPACSRSWYRALSVITTMAGDTGRRR